MQISMQGRKRIEAGEKDERIWEADTLRKVRRKSKGRIQLVCTEQEGLVIAKKRGVEQSADKYEKRGNRRRFTNMKVIHRTRSWLLNIQ